MIKLVSIDWVADHLGKHQFALIDARRPMKYLSGHLPGAINLPSYKLFGPGGRLFEPEALAELVGSAGVSCNSSAVIYDSPEGLNAAMVAWTLEYLGHPDIAVMQEFFEMWKASGRETLYKPVIIPPAVFSGRLNPRVRANLEDVRHPRNMRLVDFRSREEYSGARTVGEDEAGHIPGAANIAWCDLGVPPNSMLKPVEDLVQMTTAVGLNQGDRIVAYCRSGPRAALGYLALSQLDVDVRLFDGSFAEWSQAGLPAEK